MSDQYEMSAKAKLNDQLRELRQIIPASNDIGQARAGWVIVSVDLLTNLADHLDEDHRDRDDRSLAQRLREITATAPRPDKLLRKWRAKREIPCVGHPGRSIHYYEKAADELEALLKGGAG